MRLSHIALMTGLLTLLAACCTPNLASGATLAGQRDLAKRQDAARKASAAWESQTKTWQSNLDEGQKAQMALLVMMAANHHDTRQLIKTMEKAQKSCVTHNPQLAKGLLAAWKGWSTGAKSALTQSEKQLETVLDHQTVGTKKAVKSYLQTYHRVAQARDDLVQTIPVTSEKDCMGLQRRIGDGGEKLSNKLAISTRRLEQDLKDVLDGRETVKKAGAGNR